MSIKVTNCLSDIALMDEYTKALIAYSNMMTLKGEVIEAETAIITRCKEGTPPPENEQADFKKIFEFFIYSIEEFLANSLTIIQSTLLSDTNWLRLKYNAESALETLEQDLGISYDIYIRFCLDKLNDDSANGLISQSYSPPTDPSEAAAANIAARLANIQTYYTPNNGKTFDNSSNNAYGSFGFANKVFRLLFNANLPGSRYNAYRYQYRSLNALSEIGVLVKIDMQDTAKISELLQYAKPGDVLLCYGTGGDYCMIVDSVNAAGVTVYDCNSTLNGNSTRNLIQRYTLTWQQMKDAFSETSIADQLPGIGLYRASNYETVHGDVNDMVLDDRAQYTIEDGVLTSYLGFQEHLTVPEGVVEIAAGAFKNSANKEFIRSVKLPSSLRKIGDEAFSGLSNLSSVEFSYGLQTIGAYAFANCAYLSSILLPDSVVSLGEGCFSLCPRLAYARMSNGLTTIPDSCFDGSDYISTLILPEEKNVLELRYAITDNEVTITGCYYDDQETGCLEIPSMIEGYVVRAIADRAFSRCNGILIGDLILPNTITRIGDEAFKGCRSLDGTLSLPTSLRYIGECAFDSCSKLKGDIYLSDSVTEIGYNAFYGCVSLDGFLRIGSGLQTLGNSAFTGCFGINDVYVSESNDYFSVYNNILCDKQQTTAIFCPPQSTGVLRLPATLKTIGCEAFYYCENLVGSLVLPEGLTKIEVGAFEGCSGLSGNLVIPNSVTSIAFRAFKSAGFDGTLTIGNGLTTLTDCFTGVAFTGDLVIPNNITRIENPFARISGSSLSDPFLNGSLTLSNNLEYLDLSCGCSGTLTLPEGLKTIKKVQGNFSGPLVIPNSVVTIEESAFAYTDFSSLVLGEDLKTIGDRAFYQCNLIAGSLAIPDSVTTIGAEAFSWCNGFTGALTLGSHLTTIGEEAFSMCSFIGDLIIPNSVTSIGDKAFYHAMDEDEGVDGSNRLILSDQLEEIGAEVFAYCWREGELVIPESVVTIGDSAFESNYHLDALILPEGLTTIGNRAFYSAFKTQSRISVTMPASLRNIYSEAFSSGTSSKSKELHFLGDAPFVGGYNSSTLRSFRESDILYYRPGKTGWTTPNWKGYSCLPENQVTSVAVSASAEQLYTGDTLKLSASVMPADATDKRVNWSVVNGTGEGSISRDGLFTGLRAGTVTVKATSERDHTVYGEKVLTVNDPIWVTGITVTAINDKPITGNSIWLEAAVEPANATYPSYTWSVINGTGTATISPSGLLTCLTPGTVTVRATATDLMHVYGEKLINIQPILINSIYIDGDWIVIPGSSAQYTAMVWPKDADNQTVTWSITSGSEYATVNAETGELTGIAEGTVTLRATANDGSGVYAEREIEISDYCIEIIGESSVTAGKKLSLSGAFMPENLTDTRIIWTLEDEDKAYASISGNNLSATLTAKPVTQAHTVTVIAQAADGSAAEGTLAVTILPAVNSVQVVQITGEPSAQTDVTGKTLTLDLNDPAAAIDLRVNILPADALQSADYTVKPDGIVTVTPTDETNTVFTVVGTGTNVGTATITFKSRDGSNKTAAVKINALRLSQGLTVTDDLAATGVDGKLLAGQRTKLTAEFTGEQPSNKGIRWYMDPEYSTVATLASNGTLTAKNVTGVATVRVKAIAMDGGCESDLHEIEIVPKVTHVFIRRDDTYVTGQTVFVDLNDPGSTAVTFSMEIYPYDANQFKDWAVSDTRGQFAQYHTNDDGSITLAEFTGKTGIVTLTARANDSSKRQANVRVQFGRLAHSLSITSPKTVLRGGETITLTTNIASDRTLTDNKVIWSLSEESLPYATISGNGKLVTKPVYTKVRIDVTATASANENTTATIALDLIPAVNSVDILDNSSISVIGQTLPLDISAGEAKLTLKGLTLPEDSQQELIWTTSDARGRYSRLNENEDGTVTLAGYAPGTVTITAMAKDGTKKLAQVRVSIGRMVNSLEILNPLGDDNVVRQNKALQLAVALDGQTAAADKVTWRLEDPAMSAYASVSSGGMVTGKAVYGEHEVVIVAVAKDAAAAYDTYSVRVLPNADGILTIQDESGANLTRQTVTLEPADSKALFAYALGSSVPENVTWKTSRASVAAVDATSGQMTVRGAGTAVITATSASDAKRTATVTVKSTVLVDSITIASKTNSNQVMSGKTLTLTAGVLPVNAGKKSVTWSLSPADADYATISGNGTVKARAGLTEQVMVTATATADDGSGIKDTYDVTITPAAQGVSILLGSTALENTVQVVDMNAHRTLALSALVYPNGEKGAAQNVSWGPTSVSGAAYMDQDGTLHLMKAGTVTVTAKANDGSNKSASFKLTVTARAKSLNIASKTGRFTLRGGGRLNLLPDFGTMPPTNRKVYWSLNPMDAPYATIASNGTLTAKNITAARSVTVTVVSQDDPTITASREIELTPPVISVLIYGPDEANLTKGTISLNLSNNETTLDLSARNLPGDSAQEWIWSSSNRTVAMVDESGTVTVQKDRLGAYRTGTVTITAKASDGSNKSATVKIAILRSVTQISLSAPNGVTEVKAGKSIRITALVQPQNATIKAVDWFLRPEDLAYATVRSGTVTAKKVTVKKTILVTCTAKDGGASESIEIVVTP